MVADGYQDHTNGMVYWYTGILTYWYTIIPYIHLPLDGNDQNQAELDASDTDANNEKCDNSERARLSMASR